MHFALRLCYEKNLNRACVQLSALLGLWESAVELALTEDLELAKDIANMSPENDLELRKKLWLKIGKYHGIKLTIYIYTNVVPYIFIDNNIHLFNRIRWNE